MSTRISQDSLRPPTDYKRRFELEQHRRQNLERRVEALTLERDALKYRLQTLHERLEAELKRRGITPKTRQASLGVGA
jgi:hypothetical protein